ncbi:Amyloid-beta A4 precursor protein-binding A member 1 [Sparganum proliferum]
MSNFGDWASRGECSPNSTPSHPPASGPHPHKQTTYSPHQVISSNHCGSELDHKNSELVEVPLTSDDESENLVDLREQRSNPYEPVCLSADQNLPSTNLNNHHSGLSEVFPLFRPSSCGNPDSPILTQASNNMIRELNNKFSGQGSPLSSNSELGSISPVAFLSPGHPTHKSGAHSPSFTESCDDLKFNEELATELREQCSLLSPSVVRAITSDIEDIKRSLTGPITLPDLLPVVGQGGCRGKRTICKQFSPEHGVSSLWTDSPMHNSAEDQLLLPEKPVASPEKGLLKGRRRNIRERSFFPRIKSHSLTKSRMPQSNGHRSKNVSHPRSEPTKAEQPQQVELTTQEWMFPTHVDTVYSSSSSLSNAGCGDGGDANDGAAGGCASSSLSSDRENVVAAAASYAAPPRRPVSASRMQTHDGEWSLRVGRPRTAESSSRNSQVVTTSRIQIAANVHCSETSSSPPHSPSAIADGTLATQLSTSSVQHQQSTEGRLSHSTRRALVRENDYESDEDTDRLLHKQYQTEKPVEIPELREEAEYQSAKKRQGREVAVHHPDFPDRLIEGLLYPLRYLGSTQLTCDSRPSKVNRLRQAQEAVNRIKAPKGENQPSVPVELFISTERILVLNKELDEIVMDHNLRSISYIADIGDILVLMTRRHPVTQHQQSPPDAKPPTDQPAISPSSSATDEAGTNAAQEHPSDAASQQQPPPKVICHLFESDEAQVVAKAIGVAFQEAYFEFLREHGIEDPAAYQEQEYQNVLSQQEIFRNELQFFADKEQEKEVIVPKQRGESLGVVIVESGWGSVLPTVVLANMHPAGPAARCGQLNIGNQIISVNGQSLVGLPLATCQSFFKATKNLTAVKLMVVNCPPVVEVLIRRPDQSLLRGGIAERGGIRVDHRIIEINGESVVAVPHERIVQLLANAVGEIYIRTMPTTIFRLLTGQDVPHYI